MTDNATDIVALQAALELDPHDTTTRLVLADAYEEQGEAGDAEFHRDLAAVTLQQRDIGAIARKWQDSMTRDDCLFLAEASKEEGLREIVARLLNSSMIGPGNSATSFFRGTAITGQLYRVVTRRQELLQDFCQHAELPCSPGLWAGEYHDNGWHGFWVVSDTPPDPVVDWHIVHVTDFDPQILATDNVGYSVLQGWNAGEAVVRLVY